MLICPAGAIFTAVPPRPSSLQYPLGRRSRPQNGRAKRGLFGLGNRPCAGAAGPNSWIFFRGSETFNANFQCAARSAVFQLFPGPVADFGVRGPFPLRKS